MSRSSTLDGGKMNDIPAILELSPLPFSLLTYSSPQYFDSQLEVSKKHLLLSTVYLTTNDNM